MNHLIWEKFYHCRDDEDVSFDHHVSYRHKLPWAPFAKLKAVVTN